MSAFHVAENPPPTRHPTSHSFLPPSLPALTLFFKRSRSFRVRVSAFAMTGTILTLLCIAFMNATSKGLSLKIIVERCHIFREKGRPPRISLSQNYLSSCITIRSFGNAASPASRDAFYSTPRPLWGASDHVPMSKGGNEVEAAMHPVVHDVASVQATLVMQVPFKLLVNVGDDCLKADRKYEW